MFKQKQEEEKACCPFNSNHVFSREKFIFHLNRCKDRDKVAHLFATCPYNGLHFIKKEEMDVHEVICSDREDVKRMIATMRNNFRIARSDRERSREKAKKEDAEEQAEKMQEEEEDEDLVLSDCEDCQQLLKEIQLEKHPKLKKYLRKYEQISKVKLEH